LAIVKTVIPLANCRRETGGLIIGENNAGY
jgi:hypothetical protein